MASTTLIVVSPRPASTKFHAVAFPAPWITSNGQSLASVINNPAIYAGTMIAFGSWVLYAWSKAYRDHPEWHDAYLPDGMKHQPLQWTVHEVIVPHTSMHPSQTTHMPTTNLLGLFDIGFDMLLDNVPGEPCAAWLPFRAGSKHLHPDNYFTDWCQLGLMNPQMINPLIVSMKQYTEKVIQCVNRDIEARENMMIDAQRLNAVFRRLCLYMDDWQGICFAYDNHSKDSPIRFIPWDSEQVDWHIHLKPINLSQQTPFETTTRDYRHQCKQIYNHYYPESIILDQSAEISSQYSNTSQSTITAEESDSNHSSSLHASNFDLSYSEDHSLSSMDSDYQSSHPMMMDMVNTLTELHHLPDDQSFAVSH